MDKPEPDKAQLTIAAYKDVFSSDDAKAKRVLADLSNYCFGEDRHHIFEVNSARLTDFNLGKNDVIRYIRCMIKRKTEPEYKEVISERKPL